MFTAADKSLNYACVSYVLVTYRHGEQLSFTPLLYDPRDLRDIVNIPGEGKKKIRKLVIYPRKNSVTDDDFVFVLKDALILSSLEQKRFEVTIKVDNML